MHGLELSLKCEVEVLELTGGEGVPEVTGKTTRILMFIIGPSRDLVSCYVGYGY